MNDYCGRFNLATDMNGDFLFTISDVWLIIKFVWLLPAKLVAYLLSNHPHLGTFFEVNCTTGESWGGGLFSWVVWMALIVAFVSVAADISSIEA